MAYKKHTTELALQYQKDPFRIVSVGDSAIDKDNSDLEAYKTTRLMEHLKFLGNEAPTIFHLRLLPESLYTGVIAQYSDASNGGFKYTPILFRTMFRHCILQIDNLYDVKGTNLGTITPTEKYSEAGVGEMLIFSNKTMNDLFQFQADLVQEIGRIALHRHFLANGETTLFV